ncbi:MAG TPA: COX15/CtaA family protein [Polyangiaceae bacterium]
MTGLHSKYAWFTVTYVGAVVLFGAVVRVTGSGAGCGAHWPTCNGEIAHLPRRIQTVIELSHRLTSGLSLLAVLGLFWLIRRNYAPLQPVRRYANLALVFLLIESLLGAVLVLFGLVVNDRSLARAVVMPLHLANASALMATLGLCAFGTQHALPIRERLITRREAQLRVLLALILLASMLGALTALGDTLFPPASGQNLLSHLAADQSGRAHWLERLRIIHPAVAVLTAVYAIRVAMTRLFDERCNPLSRKLAVSIIAVITLQIAAGSINVWLNAPAYLQVVHLGLALLSFILCALLWADTGARPETVDPD